MLDPHAGSKDTGCLSWDSLGGPSSTAAWICGDLMRSPNSLHHKQHTGGMSRKWFFQELPRDLNRRQDKAAVYKEDSCDQASWPWPVAHTHAHIHDHTHGVDPHSQSLESLLPACTGLSHQKLSMKYLPYPWLGSAAPVRNQDKVVQRPAQLEIHLMGGH